MDIDTIVLGDSYRLIKEVPDKSVDLIVTDPPYQFGSVLKDAGIFGQRKMYSMMKDICRGFDMSILDELVRVMKKTNIYVWCNKEQIYDYLTYFVKGRGCNWERIIWAKENPTPFCNGHYLKDKEYCLYFWETGVNPEISYKTGRTVYLKKGMLEKDKWGHPTAKPQDIIENLIRNSSLAGGGSCLTPSPEAGRHAPPRRSSDGTSSASRSRSGSGRRQGSASGRRRKGRTNR